MWPAPNPLNGVKSRKRALFQAIDCVVSSTNGVSHISRVSVTLDSRIVAIGTPGCAAADILLNKQGMVTSASEATDQPRRHDDLVVLHLGPHLAGLQASADQHKNAIETAFQQRPQIVILDEALHGGPAWLHAYKSIIQSGVAEAFRGALVICTSEDSLSIRKLCSEEWVLLNGVIHQTDMPSISLDIIDDFPKTLAVEIPTKKASKRKGGHSTNVSSDILLDEIRQLSEHCFEEDATLQASTEGWKLAVLTDDDLDGIKHVRGYISYKLCPQPNAEMHIQRLAVPRKHRRHGYAAILVRWALAKAARMPMSECATITVSAFDTVVPFYKKFGFIVAGCDHKVATEDGDPQTWMVQQNVSLLAE